MKNSIWNIPGSLANKFWERGWDFEDPATAPVPVYDMHGHMGSYNAIYFARAEAPEMVKHLMRSGVRRLVFSHHQSLWGEFRNAQVCDIVRKFPDTLRFYISINPHRPQYIEEDIALYDSFKPYVVGFKILPDYHRVKASDPRYSKPLEYANEHHLPVLVHTWTGSPFDDVDELIIIAKRYPNAVFFVGHSFANTAHAAQMADVCDNAFFELTSRPGHYGVLEEMVRTIGSNRIIFGTDMPWFDEFQHIGGVLAADISDADKENILYKNIDNLLGKNW